MLDKLSVEIEYPVQTGPAFVATNNGCSALFTTARPRDDGGTIGGDRHTFT